MRSALPIGRALLTLFGSCLNVLGETDWFASLAIGTKQSAEKTNMQYTEIVAQSFLPFGLRDQLAMTPGCTLSVDKMVSPAIELSL